MDKRYSKCGQLGGQEAMVVEVIFFKGMHIKNWTALKKGIP